MNPLLPPEAAEALLVALIAVCTIASWSCLVVVIADVLRERRDRKKAATEAERLRTLRDTFVVKSRLDLAAFRASQALRKAAERARDQAP